MSPIFEVVVYAVQIFLLQWISTPILSDLTYRQALKKNSQWIEENPDFLTQHPQVATKGHKILAMVLLTFICVGLFTKFSISFSFAAHVVSILVFAGNYVCVDLLRNRRMMRLIPAPKIRRASLAPRNISSFVALPLFGGLLMVALIVIACWAHVARQNPHMLSPAVLDIAGLFACLATLLYVIKRKPTTQDTESYEGFRKAEVTGALLIFIGFLILAAVQLAGTQFDLKIFKYVYIITNCVFTLLLTGGLMVFLTSKAYRNLVR